MHRTLLSGTLGTSMQYILKQVFSHSVNQHQLLLIIMSSHEVEKGNAEKEVHNGIPALSIG